MAFQPFGYKFDIRSASRVADVKADIRARKKGWFDPGYGARGWICGPFICLWFSAFDRYGPMLFGLIRQDGFGSRIHGRAGSDLNGVLLVAISLPWLVLVLFGMLAAVQHEWSDIAVIGGFILLMLLCFWLAHSDRREAEPLVRFLRDILTATGRSLRATSERHEISEGLTLIVGSRERDAPASALAVHDALLGLGEGDFAILERASEDYIQTMLRDGSFTIEMRRGTGSHFQAARRGVLDTDDARLRFSFEQALAAFLAFGSGKEMPSTFLWLPMSLPG
ncbi:hypothetical protein [Sphingopyxis sp. GW247-27LB]|uniref:hypothetical protein n=1 Tax=Sphingopyxis sp. GW247-27LB TaxID=2012632 RepID=UPI000BA6D96F|nr:hypothetical protein [Sphingopyxis sp. GW247-27LB]PAL25034.1 hypothetical protein CD928_00480 [Sphingopyxis sp. GW247-27LB]